MLASSLIIGAGVPVALFYIAYKTASWVFLAAAALLGALAIFWGAVMALAAFVPILDYVDALAEERGSRLNAYRALARSLLEELDEVNAVLKEIRDELKRLGET
ncbi:hypothetical protein [Pyrobaculum neutrophilum]|uniref:Uncharacterized protein n=1 Tax=Pyrobaculum neutrophilum (strain DSM 2338 / JCM 9278 / NBRC 100436 / V24Sta) TaxID=444157 RepID=B1YE20_PYRNV|nr:hypothetical protein [Pyrobaculum neutrophilum]ACB40033.1 conserved hypothetical protein [Pyrobaculum neutrophilum V24Sta]